jgi:hypothetical protein
MLLTIRSCLIAESSTVSRRFVGAAMCLLLSACMAMAVQSTRGDEPVQTKLVFDISFADWPVEPPDAVAKDKLRHNAWRKATWGKQGLELAMDTVLAAGSKRIHFRAHAAGPYWPTKVAGAACSGITESMLYTQASLDRVEPTLKTWNLVASAVKAAHRKGITILGWFDLTEGHAGLPTKWALDHPQFCMVDRKGIRLDGPVGLVSRKGVRLERAHAESIDYSELIAEGFMGPNCERPNGTSIDPQLSFAYPEVVEYRLALLRELLSFGVDGIFLVACGNAVGYEPPVVESFQKQYGIDPRTIGEYDPRWTRHQGWYFTDFVRKLHELIRQEEKATGRKIELVVEGQGGWPGPNQNMQPEPGLPEVLRWAFMPDWMDAGTMAREKLVDGLCFWTFREAGSRLSPEARANVSLLSRYRNAGASFTQANVRTRLAEAGKQGFSYLILNENRGPLATQRWMYPGEPGPLYKLAQ